MRGLKGMESLALEAIEKARYIEKQIRSQPDKYEMAHNPMGTNICWWYIPPALKDNYTKEMKGKVSKIIYERMSKQGTMLIQYNPIKEFDMPNCFRLVLKGDRTTIDDMDYILSEIDRLGKDITEADL